jgi:hypothetical protein
VMVIPIGSGVGVGVGGTGVGGTGVDVAVGGIGVAVGGTGVGVGGTGVGVAAGAPHPTKSNVTNVTPIICCSNFWQLIFALLSSR